MNVNILTDYLETFTRVLGRDQGNSLPCLFRHRTTRLHLRKERLHYSCKAIKGKGSSGTKSEKKQRNQKKSVMFTKAH